MNIQNGPYGGGNQFGRSLSSYLVAQGNEVFSNLQQKDVDIILLTDPRAHLHSVSFGPIDILNYVKKINKKVIIIQRVNECDERKGTKTVNRQLVLANSIMDHTVYIGSWLVDLFKKQGLVFTQQHSIIKNGADPSVFTFEKKILDPSKKIKLVTHHWASHWMKGWDVYSYLDMLLGAEDLGSQFEFHYIGSPPKNVMIKNIQLHPACAGKELALLIKSCDIYVTASLNEPAGMHHIEGALCGLPLLYRNSGALPEYCDGYGVKFNGTEDIISALHDLVSQYDFFANKMADYHQTSDNMCGEYLKLFNQLLEEREGIIRRRTKSQFSKGKAIEMKSRFFWYRLLSKLNFE